MLRTVVAAVVLGTTMAIVACTSTPPQGPNPFSVAVAFDNPPAYPGYQWTRNGHAVSTAELGASAGPNHCDWQSATILTIGWPLGTVAQTSAHSRSYIRDPKGVMGGTYQPRLMKEHAGLHPILVLIALLVGAQIAGLWGALFGIPFVAVLNLLVRYVVNRQAVNEVEGIDLEETVAEVRAADPDLPLDEAVAIAADQAETISTDRGDTLQGDPPA